MVSAFSRKDFLEALFDEYFQRFKGFVMVKVSKGLGHKVGTRYFPSPDVLVRQQYTEDQNVFFGVCPRESMKPGRAGVRHLVALWAGVDFGAQGFSGRENYFEDIRRAALAIRSFPIPPSIVVESGWGVHLYWLMNGVPEITDFRRIERILERINQYFRCDREMRIDASMRLPGTINNKVLGQPITCNVKFVNPEFRYDIEEFEGLEGRIFGSGAARGEEVSAIETADDEALPGGDPGAFGPGPVESEVPRYADQTQPHEGLASRPAVTDFEPVPYPGTEDYVTPPSESQYSHAKSEEAVDDRSPRPTSTEDDYITVPDMEVPDAVAAPTTGASSLATEVEAVEVLEELQADDIADAVVSKLVNEFRESLIDEIVERVVERLSKQSDRR